jgi:WD40 repeat protein
MRHHAIEMNWRVKPIRMPIILKGHDDHVITCLQFCGNQVVSGSDDNTLKVWSVITGKVSLKKKNDCVRISSLISNRTKKFLSYNNYICKYICLSVCVL